MQIFHYSPVTNEFTGSSMARESPLERGVFLMPAHATDIAPPLLKANQAAVFSGGAWSVVPDHRGEKWYQPDGSEAEIAELDVVPDRTWSQTPPPPSAEQKQQELRGKAQAALSQTDIVASRCFKAGIPFPPAWQRYTAAVRNIANGTDSTSTSLPEPPAYPAGT